MFRTSVPAPRYVDVVKSLETNDLLPAIIFIGSRRGCDEATDSFRSNAIVDLSRAQREQILAEIDNLPAEDRDFARRHRFFHVIVNKGVASHHAGHLPIWKHVVERLMSKGLLRAVFSTTTLAAGIDMPARSVVIGASSVRDDEGHRDLKAFELAQMTGRAGRRGKDKVGFAVFIPGPFQDINLILDLLGKPPEPIESQFAANYTMVLNLLQQHTPEAARDLLEKSFSHYQRIKKLARIEPKYQAMLVKLKEDTQDRPCSDRIATWNEFRDLDRELLRVRKTLKAVKRRVNHELDAELEPESLENLPKAEETFSQLQAQQRALPCGSCLQKPFCGNVVTKQQYYQQESQRLEQQLHDLQHGLWERFELCAQILQSFDYLTTEWQPTADGIWASKLRVENTLLVAELVRGGYFNTTNPRLLAALCGALSAGDREIEINEQDGEEEIFEPFNKALKIARSLAKHQERVGIFFPIVLDGDTARVLWLWADNKLDWHKLFQELYAEEGDIVRLILRTSDLLSQLIGIQETHPTLADTARKAIALIRRPPIDD